MDSAAYIIAHAAEIFSTLVQWLVGVIGRMGYAGIAGLMFLESSFFPFPSEVVVPPAGYLAWKGEMNLFLVIASGIAGSVLGGLFNYWVAIRWGRPLFEKYGKDLQLIPCFPYNREFSALFRVLFFYECRQPSFRRTSPYNRRFEKLQILHSLLHRNFSPFRQEADSIDECRL